MLNPHRSIDVVKKNRPMGIIFSVILKIFGYFYELALCRTDDTLI